MSNNQPDLFPKGALRIREALCQFVSNELWREYQRAEAIRRRFPERPMRQSRWVHGSEAEESIRIASQTHSAQLKLEGAWQAILRLFVNRLVKGELTAIAQSDPPFGKWRAIPAERWQHLRISDVNAGRVVGPNVDLADVHVIEGDRPPPLARITPRKPGRPSSLKLIIEEFCWRVEAEEAYEGLREEAKYLSDWLEQTPSIKEKMKSRTVEKNLSELFRAWKAGEDIFKLFKNWNTKKDFCKAYRAWERERKTHRQR